jgi:uncharacterized membrane protein
MKLTEHESDFERREFAAYIATVITVLIAVAELARYFALRSNSTDAAGGSEGAPTGLIPSIAYIAHNNQFLGLILITAAFLLMIDSDEEPLRMKLSLVIVAVLGALLLLACVVGAADQFTQTLVTSQLIQELIDYVSTGILAFGALALTWPAVRNLRFDDMHVAEVDDASE